MRDNDMPSETHNGAASGSASDGCLGNDFTPREKLPETGTTLDCSDRKGDPISTQWDGRYERGYGERGSYMRGGYYRNPEWDEMDERRGRR